jgi:hypothetical protein
MGPDQWQKRLRTMKVRGGWPGCSFRLITPAVWLRLPCWVARSKAKSASLKDAADGYVLQP